MKAYLKAFFNSFGYPQEARIALLAAYDAIYACKAAAVRFDAAMKAYEQDMNYDFGQLLDAAQTAAHEAGIHEYTGKFLLCACISARLREYYAAAGLKEELWRTAMNDLLYKLIECRLVYGIWGSFVCAWFNRFFNLTRFALGRLQFELIRFGKNYKNKDVQLDANSTVINVHIPRTGGRLLPSEIEDAYARAAAFFRERYGLERIVFVCHSWLLYPKNLEVLSEKANLRRFIADYDIIEWNTYRDYSEVWRLFDMNFEGNADQLPQNTSFRRAYVDWIRKNVPIGWGYGVYGYEDKIENSI